MIPLISSPSLRNLIRSNDQINGEFESGPLGNQWCEEDYVVLFPTLASRRHRWDCGSHASADEG